MSLSSLLFHENLSLQAAQVYINWIMKWYLIFELQSFSAEYHITYSVRNLRTDLDYRTK